MYSPKSVPHHVTTPTTYILRCLVVVTMIVAAATFLHVNNYRPKQTFLSCDRPCHHLDWPMICRVKLTLEVFQSLSKSCGDCPLNQTACLANHCISADGQRRGILTANRQMPGPSIQVCENDILVVDVINRLPGKAAAVHWRGQTQMEMPYMDGTPLVTQCPIPSYTTFQYKFRASIPGTHLWHAHAGADVTDGIIGSLIVRQADLREPHRALYDIDDPNHVVLVTQWQHSLPEVPFNQEYLKPVLLINGKGRQPNGPAVPFSTFTVIPGRRHRFRVANAGGAGACPVTLFIDGHSLLLIALDGHPIEPRQVTSITLAKGERADFVLKASKRIGSYWMNVHTAKECGTNTINGAAMLNYKGNSENPAATAEAIDQRDIDEIGSNRMAVTTNPAEKCSDRENLCAMNIRSIHKIPQSLTKPGTDVTLYLPINYKMQATELIGNSGTETRVLNVNNVTFTFPPSPLLTQDVSPGMLCTNNDNNEDDLNESNETMSRRRCRQVGDVGASDICECVHVRHVPLGAIVEIILLDQGGLDDLVYHLHGYSFYVVGARQFGRSVSLQELKKLDEKNQLFSRNLDCALIKDTIVVPKFGAVALRFKADNPGYWMLRDEHATDWTRGLDVILQVGELSDMVTPPQDFPKCGSFVGPDYFLI